MKLFTSKVRSFLDGTTISSLTQLSTEIMRKMVVCMRVRVRICLCVVKRATRPAEVQADCCGSAAVPQHPWQT